MTSSNGRVPLLDVARDNGPLREEVLEALGRVWDSGRFLHGAEVQELERVIAADCQVTHAIGCASGSDALLLALMALGVGPGDEVIVPSFTFFATASAVWRLHATIVFADIDPVTFNIDPTDVARRISARTKAIIPVHLYGQAADMTRLLEVAKPRAIPVIEDAAQAIGARHAGRPVGSWGQAGCLSFYPTKNLGGCGDGGMLTTSDDLLAARLRLFAAHGMNPRYYHQVVGINSRLDTFQAAALLVKQKRLAEWTRARQSHAARYHELFAASAQRGTWCREIILPECRPENEHVWNQFSVRIPHGRRDALREYLTQRGIGSEIYYPLPLHLQDCFRSLGYGPGSLPQTERAAAEVLNLPIFPGLTTIEQRWVVDAIAEFGAARRVAA